MWICVCVCVCVADCKESDKLHKATALLLQGFLGFVGAGSMYIGNVGLAVSSVAAVALLVLSAAFLGSRSDDDASGAGAAKKKKSDDGAVAEEYATFLRTKKAGAELPEEEAASRMGARTVAVSVLGGIVVILWLVGLVGIATDLFMPTNGCGWV